MSKVEFAIGEPSSIAHILRPGSVGQRRDALCGRTPDAAWTRTFDQDLDPQRPLLGICAICLKAVAGPGP